MTQHLWLQLPAPTSGCAVAEAAALCYAAIPRAASQATDSMVVSPAEAGELKQSNTPTARRGRLWTLPMAAAVAGVLAMAA